MVLVFLAAGLTIARELVRASSYIIRDRMLVQIGVPKVPHRKRRAFTGDKYSLQECLRTCLRLRGSENGLTLAEL